jgi:hypothetical protein
MLTLWLVSKEAELDGYPYSEKSMLKFDTGQGLIKRMGMSQTTN